MALTNDNIKRAGILQEMGKPLASLYVDTKTRRLYLFVLTSSFNAGTETFIATEVTPSQIEGYINEQYRLINIIRSGKNWDVKKIGKEYSFEELHHFSLTDDMKRLDVFDPDLCEDDIWIETFLDRIVSGRPIE